MKKLKTDMILEIRGRRIIISRVETEYAFFFDVGSGKMNFHSIDFILENGEVVK